MTHDELVEALRGLAAGPWVWAPRFESTFSGRSERYYVYGPGVDVGVEELAGRWKIWGVRPWGVR